MQQLRDQERTRDWKDIQQHLVSRLRRCVDAQARRLLQLRHDAAEHRALVLAHWHELYAKMVSAQSLLFHYDRPFHRHSQMASLLNSSVSTDDLVSAPAGVQEGKFVASETLEMNQRWRVDSSEGPLRMRKRLVRPTLWPSSVPLFPPVPVWDDEERRPRELEQRGAGTQETDAAPAAAGALVTALASAECVVPSTESFIISDAVSDASEILSSCAHVHVETTGAFAVVVSSTTEPSELAAREGAEPVTSGSPPDPHSARALRQEGVSALSSAAVSRAPLPKVPALSLTSASGIPLLRPHSATESSSAAAESPTASSRSERTWVSTVSPHHLRPRARYLPRSASEIFLRRTDAKEVNRVSTPMRQIVIMSNPNSRTSTPSQMLTVPSTHTHSDVLASPPRPRRTLHRRRLSEEHYSSVELSPKFACVRRGKGVLAQRSLAFQQTNSVNAEAEAAVEAASASTFSIFTFDLGAPAIPSQGLTTTGAVHSLSDSMDGSLSLPVPISPLPASPGRPTRAPSAEGLPKSAASAGGYLAVPSAAPATTAARSRVNIRPVAMVGSGTPRSSQETETETEDTEDGDTETETDDAEEHDEADVVAPSLGTFVEPPDIDSHPSDAALEPSGVVTTSEESFGQLMSFPQKEGILTGSLQKQVRLGGEDRLRLLLEDGDDIIFHYNCLRVVGLDEVCAVLLFCTSHIYVIDNFLVTQKGEIVQLQLQGRVADTSARPYSEAGAAFFKQISAHTAQKLAVTEADLKRAEDITSHEMHAEERGHSGRFDKSSDGGSLSARRWSYMEVRECHKCRYLLRPAGLELLFEDGTSFLLVLNPDQRDSIFQNFATMCPAVRSRPLLNFFVDAMSKPESSGRDASARSLLKGATLRWQNGQLSNFEYILQLNWLAGRTYNDLTQYPVFPWVLSNYHSSSLATNDPRVYRDLSKPMGALNKRRANEFRQRFNDSEVPSWTDPNTPAPRFHYGTHYSTAGIVLYYLLRLEPFTQFALKFQSGKFDRPDRLFQSIRSSWISASERNTSDVKELIPEFFYMPEFLQNGSDLDLGTRQNGEQIDNVVLPPWARGSFREFIRIHRQALESEHVSAQLHHWIDLIFGVKQQGKAAEEALNVFYYLTYAGQVDIDAISDPVQKEATIEQIRSFGQTPRQLFTKPHVKRKMLSDTADLFYPPLTDRFAVCDTRGYIINVIPTSTAAAAAFPRFDTVQAQPELAIGQISSPDVFSTAGALSRYRILLILFVVLCNSN